MPNSSAVEFGSVRDNEWDCFVIGPEEATGLRVTEASIKRKVHLEDRSMPASEAAIGFVELHAATPSGECYLRVRSPLGEYDFVARVGWGELWCEYECPFEEWSKRRESSTTVDS